METLTATASSAQQQLTRKYLAELDKHIAALKAGQVTQAYEIRDFAAMLFVHPVHLSNTIKETTGKSTCDLYEERLLRIAKELLTETDDTIATIARQLTYDPSNFTKFFKHFTGITPKQYRQSMTKS